LTNSKDKVIEKKKEREREERREREGHHAQGLKTKCVMFHAKKNIYTLYNNANGKMIFTIKKDKKNYYDNYVCNPDAIIIKKLGYCGSPKIIIIIATSLTSNNFIDVP
jgi:hypothetical protein